MTDWLGVIVVTAIYMIAIIGVSILSGFTGLFSLGHAAFMAIGAYTSAILSTRFKFLLLWDWLLERCLLR